MNIFEWGFFSHLDSENQMGLCIYEYEVCMGGNFDVFAHQQNRPKGNEQLRHFVIEINHRIVNVQFLFLQQFEWNSMRINLP